MWSFSRACVGWGREGDEGGGSKVVRDASYGDSVRVMFGVAAACVCTELRAVQESTAHGKYSGR